MLQFPIHLWEIYWKFMKMFNVKKQLRKMLAIIAQ